MRSDYADLSHRIRDAGLLAPQPRYYLAKLGIGLVCFGAILWALWSFRAPWQLAGLAVVWAFVSAQLAFLFHEAGHRQIFSSRGKNALIGIFLGNFLLGISYGWWVRKHDEHHANPNHEDLDPDIDIPLLAFSPEQAATKHGIYRFVSKYQAAFLFPLLSLVVYGQHYASARFLGERSRYRGWEIAAIVAHAVLYLGVPLLVLGPWSALLLVLVHHAAAGVYVGSVFAPNHKGMPVLGPGDALDPLRRQVLTSRNIRAHVLTDFWYGGLNYQIEHHLFPSLPRNQLRAAQPIIRDFCTERGIRYHETSMLGSYGEILAYLHEIGAPLRQRSVSAPVSGD